ncbi:MAG: hypothetical protein KDB21_11375 [Acidimicrobiales bacterium]|nr:hypothetical protein [Acidimicrobiales bacterium]
MLSSITPFGERSRNSRWGLTVAFYLVGNVVGGIAIACAFGAIGLLVDPLIGDTTAIGILAVAGIVGVALELHLFGLRLPSYHRQVNEVWLTAFRGWVYGLGFGFQLGLGIATIVTTAATYLFMLAAVLVGSLTGAAIIGVVFGLARGLCIFAAAHIQTPEQLRTFHLHLNERARIIHRLTIAAVSVVTGAAVVTALA